jgi:anti-sigma factor RsiW
MSTTVTHMHCRDIVPLLAGLADETQAPEPSVARHLAECPGCRQQLQVQRDVHGLLRARAATLQGRAPEALRARLATTRTTRPQARWWGMRLPVTATVALALTGVLLYGATGASSTLLAAQLTLDHMKCVRLHESHAALDAAEATRDWAARYGWTPRLPAAPRTEHATLIGVRRCLYGHGHVVHLLYDVEGRVVSLFVMPREAHPAGDAPTAHAFLGQQAAVWSKGDQSFALVGDVPASRLATLAGDFRAGE